MTRSVAAGLPISLSEIENNARGGALKLIGEISIEVTNLAKRNNKFFGDEVSNIQSVQ